jgi:hypothetical protein
MPHEAPDVAAPGSLREKALSRWDNEGGALCEGPQEQPTSHEPRLAQEPRLTNAELVRLRVRVIALENLVIALLAEGSDRQVAVAREMAAYISPRPALAHHPQTIRAAAHMIDLVERAACFRTEGPQERPPTPTPGLDD